MSSRSEIDRSIRRLKPEKHLSQLTRRNRLRLPFLDPAEGRLPKLLLDTTVYIDELQGRFPANLEIALRTAELWHSTVTEAELAASFGLLNPRHAETPHVLGQIAASLEKRPAHRVLNHDEDVWREGGILAGLMARIQNYDKREYRRVLNDSLIFLSAAKEGCTVLTRNATDFDFLQQLAPFGRVLYYEQN